jgi:hypothetical protein
MNSRTAIAKIFFSFILINLVSFLAFSLKVQKEEALSAINNKFCRKWSSSSPHVIQSAEQKSSPIITTLYDLNF